MAARSQWKGFLKLSLVSIPVKAYSSATSAGGIGLNQLHAECNSRVRYKKTCPIHGEIPASEIVSGYEYAKDQYVVVDTDELEKLRTEDDKAIQIDVFIKPDAIDPLYLNGKSYFLVPEGPIAQKSFQVVRQAMEESGRYAVAQVVFNGKEQVVLLRPEQGLIVMSIMYFNSQVSSPTAFEDEIPKGPIESTELQLAKNLIKSASTDKFDLAKYKDVYTEKLSKLIEAKVEGQELVSPPPSQPVEVINLMDALKKSLEKAGKSTEVEAPETKKPPRKMAPSKGVETKAKRRKSS